MEIDDEPTFPLFGEGHETSDLHFAKKIDEKLNKKVLKINEEPKKIIQTVYMEPPAFEIVVPGKNIDPVFEMCAVAYYCAESVKMWSQASAKEKGETFQRVKELVEKKRTPTTRRDRAVMSIWNLRSSSSTVENQVKRINESDASEETKMAQIRVLSQKIFQEF